MRTWKVSLLACSAVGAAFLAPTLAVAGGQSSVTVSKVIVYPDPPPFAPPLIVIGTNIPTPTTGNTSSGNETQVGPTGSQPASQGLNYSVAFNTNTPYAQTYTINKLGQEIPNGELYQITGTITITAATNFQWSTVEENPNDIVNGDYVGPIAGLEFQFPVVASYAETRYYVNGGSVFTAPNSFYSLTAFSPDLTDSTAPISGCVSGQSSTCFYDATSNGQVLLQYINSVQVDGVYQATGLDFTQGQTAVYDFTLLDFIPSNISAPEPGTWALMLLGFGAVGFALRRRAARSLLAPV